MKKVVVIGAGFSGMAAAFFLTRAGFTVDIYEKENHSGGLINTVKTEWGLVETAANGLLNSNLFEDLAQTIGLKIVQSNKESRRRYIYRNKPMRWPLTLVETVALFFKITFSWSRKPKPQETIEKWGKRIVGSAATSYVLAPALQGIYAGGSELSASLILSRFFNKNKGADSRKRSLVAPENGMKELFEKLEHYLKNNGVRVHYGSEYKPLLNSSELIHVIAISAKHVGPLLKNTFSNFGEIATLLSKIEMLSLVRVTAFFRQTNNVIKGFGVLFPRNQGFRSLGILFNNFIFSRGNNGIQSQSYIMGGVNDKDILSLSDNEILKLVKEDHLKLFKETHEVLGFHIQRWPNALPFYSLQLEATLKELENNMDSLNRKNIYLIGNYLGGIGLSQLLGKAAQLPETIKRYQ